MITIEHFSRKGLKDELHRESRNKEGPKNRNKRKKEKISNAIKKHERMDDGSVYPI